MTNNTYDNTYIHTNVRQYIVAEVDYRGSAAPKKREKKTVGAQLHDSLGPASNLQKNVLCSHRKLYIFPLCPSVRFFNCLSVRHSDQRSYYNIFVIIDAGGGPSLFFKALFLQHVFMFRY